jgi:hypothetical protein
MPPCKTSPGSVVREVEFPGVLLDRATGTPKQPVMYSKNNIYLIYC